LMPVLRHHDPHILKQKLHLVRIGARIVQQQNLLALVLDEMDTIVHCGFRGSQRKSTLTATPRPCTPLPAPSPAPPHPCRPLRPDPDARRLCRRLFAPPHPPLSPLEYGWSNLW